MGGEPTVRARKRRAAPRRRKIRGRQCARCSRAVWPASGSKPSPDCRSSRRRDPNAGRATDLLLALDQKRQITRKLRARFQIGLDGFEVREVLAFVVARAAAKKRAPRQARLERRRFPKLERLGRLHVVVSINQIVRPGGSVAAWGL